MKKSVVFIIAAVVFVLGVYVVRYLDAPVETKIARMIEHEESFAGEAYFVRKESVYQAQSSGTFYPYTQEGARVGKDRLIAVVYNGVVDNQTLQELNNLDKKIAEIEEYNKNNVFVLDESDSENRLKNLKNGIIEAVINREPSKISKIKNDIKRITSGEQADNTAAEIEDLKNQKKTIESRLGRSKSDIHSDSSGVFSTNIDGLESILTVDKIEEYTVEDFNSLSEQQTEAQSKSAALQGEPVCKVIDNHTWYAMVRVPAQKLATYEKGQIFNLRFDSIPGVEAEAKLIQISHREEEADAIAIFACEQYIEGIFSIRQSSVEVIAKQYRGFEIPISAVRVKNGQQGVMVQYGINEIFKPCNVIYTNKEHNTVIIEPITEDVKNPLAQYDKIVLGEKTK